MLEISEWQIGSPEHRALRAGVSTPTAVAFASLTSRTFEQPFAIPLESHPSKTRVSARLQIHPFAAAESNPFRMTTFHKRQNNLGGDNGPAAIPSPGTPLESAHTREYLFQKPFSSKPFRMTTFSNPAKQLLCNDNVCKKGGGRGVWPQFSGRSLNQENLSESEPNAPNVSLARRAATAGSGKHSLPRREDMIMCSPI
jgi:hypothetical protein